MAREKSSYWKAKRVLATGGAGFLGRHVVSRLEAAGAKVFVPRSATNDLTRQSNVERLYKEFPTDLVIHMAGQVGGIGANRDNPGKFFYDNIMMGAMLMEAARVAK